MSVEKKKMTKLLFDKVAIISVKDTGIGINSEIFPILFTKFASKSERGGTGSGLPIMRLSVTS